MVRFIIEICPMERAELSKFTFQYGQIYYTTDKEPEETLNFIYIPIWLDLLYIFGMENRNLNTNLHSNMVRFIIKINVWEQYKRSEFTFQYGQIYYYLITKEETEQVKYLHSNMVRFIICRNIIIVEVGKIIYIPIWLDLLYNCL